MQQTFRRSLSNNRSLAHRASTVFRQGSVRSQAACSGTWAPVDSKKRMRAFRLLAPTKRSRVDPDRQPRKRANSFQATAKWPSMKYREACQVEATRDIIVVSLCQNCSKSALTCLPALENLKKQRQAEASLNRRKPVSNNSMSMLRPSLPLVCQAGLCGWHSKGHGCRGVPTQCLLQLQDAGPPWL